MTAGDLSASGDLLDVDVNVDADVDVSASVAGAVAANANVAAPIDAAVAPNIGSVDSEATAVAQQTAIINQDLDGVTADATADHDSEITQYRMTVLHAPDPARAPGMELLGEFTGSGYNDAPSLVRRSDGQTVQVTPLLYQLLEALDGERDMAQLAGELELRSGDEAVHSQKRGRALATVHPHRGFPFVAALDSRNNGEAPQRVWRTPMRRRAPRHAPRFIAKSPIAPSDAAMARIAAPRG